MVTTFPGPSDVSGSDANTLSGPHSAAIAGIAQPINAADSKPKLKDFIVPRMRPRREKARLQQ
jgi:hypothetical protein